MIKYILFITLILPVSVFAKPASEIAWTPELLKFVNNGNRENGKALAASCSACHGENGVSEVTTYPSLAGQNPNYLYKQLRDYAGGFRDNALMNSVAQGLTEKDSADLAAWFASLPMPSNQSSTAINLTRAEKMVEDGDGKRILPPCFVCHGANGQGEKMDIPALAGQHAEYTINTLMEYKNGKRHNDIYSRMRLIVEQLSEEEIKELAHFYQQFN